MFIRFNGVSQPSHAFICSASVKDICWQDGRRIVELKTLAEQINACDGCDTPLNLMNIEQERLHGMILFRILTKSNGVHVLVF
jgi:hypothetical protein